MAQRYVYEYNASHPLASADGTVLVHRRVLYDAIGEGPHKCNWCPITVHWKPTDDEKELVVDHLDNISRNNSVENLVPSCHVCNSSRQAYRKIEDGEVFTIMTGARGKHRAVVRVCKACGTTFEHIAADTRPNRGQFCSVGCANTVRGRRRLG